MQDDKLDLGFMAFTEKNIPGITFEPLAREEFVLITPLSHPLAQKRARSGEPLTTVSSEVREKLTFCLMYRESTQRDALDN